MSFDDIRFGARKDVAQMGCTTSSGRSPLSTCASDDSHLISSRERAIRELDRNGVKWRTPTEEAKEQLQQVPAQLLQDGHEVPTIPTTSEGHSSPEYEFVSNYLKGSESDVSADAEALPAKPKHQRIAARRMPGRQEMEKRRAEVAKLRDAGIVISKNSVYTSGDPSLRMPTLTCWEMSGRKDFRSAPNAREMTIDDIRNVEEVGAMELRRTLESAAARLGLVVGESDPRDPERPWGHGWDDADPRWQLSPHQLRKLRNRQRRSDK